MEPRLRSSSALRKLHLFDQVHPSSDESTEDLVKNLVVEKVSLCRAQIGPDYSLDEGVIEGSVYCLAVPISTSWNGHLLVYCHGNRPEGIELTADLNLYDDLYNRLILDGWIVGHLSYRREGVIINDAILDINNLRAYVKEKYGEPQFCILEGESMGGHIVTLVAERHPELYQGVFSIGAALCPTKQDSHESDREDKIKFTHVPLMPHIFLTNFTETSYIQQYIDNVTLGKYKPRMWAVLRPGHCNVNVHERNYVFQSLVKWAKQGVEPPVEHDEITYFVESRPSEVLFDNPENPHLGGAWGKMFTYNVYGDIETNFQEEDINKLGIRPGKLHMFQVTFKIDDYVSKHYQGFYGTSGDAFDVNVPTQAWMLWIHANGYAILCKNNSLTELTSAVSYQQFSPGHYGIYLKYIQQPRGKLQSKT